MIHLSSIGIPLLYMWLTRETMLALVVPAFLLSLAIEFLRTRVPAVEQLFSKLFGQMLRPHEKEGKRKISGATFVLFSAALCILIFPKVVTITGFTVLIVSDTASALYGRRFGRHRFLEKSVEGSSAFVVTAVMVVLGVAAIYDAPWEFLVAGIIASFVAAVAEAMSYGVNIDDNLTIPLSFGASIWGLLLLFGGPEIDLLLSIR